MRTIAKNIKCSNTVKSEKNRLYCGHSPMDWVMSDRESISLPLIMMRPLVFLIIPRNVSVQMNYGKQGAIPVIMPIVVDFPAPLCPSKTVI